MSFCRTSRLHFFRYTFQIQARSSASVDFHDASKTKTASVSTALQIEIGNKSNRRSTETCQPTHRTRPPFSRQGRVRIPRLLSAVDPTRGIAALDVGVDVQKGKAVGGTVAGVAAGVFGLLAGVGEGVVLGDVVGDDVIELLEVFVVGAVAGGVGSGDDSGVVLEGGGGI